MHLLDLFCGTKSISREFEKHGWTTTSVDFDEKTQPDICLDILHVTKELILEYGRPDAVWASPLCTHYSVARTTAKTPRDLVGSDKLVAKALEIASWFNCPFFLENPHSGLLKSRDVVRGISMGIVDYCQYADEDFRGRYRKRTAIWTNTDWIPSRALCKPVTCQFCSNNKRHDTHVTRSYSLNQLYSIPEAIPREICVFLNSRLSAQTDSQSS